MPMRLPRRLSTSSAMGAAIALVWIVYGVATLHAHGLTSDEPGLFYAGDRTLFWLLHPRALDALDFAGAEPAGFVSEFLRWPDWKDPMHYPVFPSLLAAITSRLFHDGLGWVSVIDGHHLGLVLFHGLGLWVFCRWATRLLGDTAGVAATVALALYPTFVGHAFSNPKDLPCALWNGIAVLAAGVGLLENRGKPLIWAGLFLGVALSCKLNGVFALIAVLAWTPFAYLILYRRRRPFAAEVMVGLLIFPYLGLVVFVLLWPWLYQGKGIAIWWAHLNDYVSFLLAFGTSDRSSWVAYPAKALVFMTPPLVLLAAAVALGTAWRRGRERAAIVLLLVLAGGLPVLRIAAPRSNFYDANRHFIEYVPALCALAGLGVAELARWGRRLLARLPAGAAGGARVTASGLTVAAVAVLIWPLAAYRPFEAAYFNRFVGGLGGAQQAALLRAPFNVMASGTEADYWWSSSGDGVAAARAIDPQAPVAMCGGSTALLPIELRTPGKGPRFVEPDDPAALVYVNPREAFCSWKRVRELEAKRPVLRRVERGGGLIWELLGPATGASLSPVSRENGYTK